MEKSHIVIGSVKGFEAQEFDNNCILKISEIIHCVQTFILSRKEKGGNTASHTATSIASVRHKDDNRIELSNKSIKLHADISDKIEICGI